eukprot:gene3310-1645_t
MGWHDLDIDAGLVGGEETQRFGPRNEKGSSLYQVDTLACISPKEDEEHLGCPTVSSIANQAGICLVIGNNVVLFDESCSAPKVHFSFGTNVDAVAWNSDSNFMAVGESSGVLNLTHIPSKQVIFSQNILNNETQKFRSLVFNQGDAGLYELKLLPSQGFLIQLKNINLKQLDDAISSKDSDGTKEVLKQISREIVNVSTVHSESLDHIIDYEREKGEELLIAGQGDYGLSVWENDDDGKISMADVACDYFDQGTGYLKCLLSPSGEYFIALDTERRIRLWSTDTLTPLIFYNDVQVKDFILYWTNPVEEDARTKDSSEDIKLVVLTMPENKKSLLQVYSLPNFEHVYTLQVSACSTLASVDSQLDTIYFIEGVEDCGSFFEDEVVKDEMDISSIRLRCLTEALPSSRFMRLLHKQKFDQAIEFAKQYNLDVELVYCVKVSAILNQLEPWGRSGPKTDEEYEDSIKELKKCLDRITDTSQIINYCIDATLRTFDATFDLLKYAKKRLDSKDGSWTSTANVQSLLDALNRLITFEVAFGSKKFSADAWKSFLNASLLNEVMNCFETNVAAAIVIWRRHQSELEAVFTSAKLEPLLSSIPESTPSSKIIKWLKEDFVPFVLTKVPDGQVQLVKWLDARARNMEITEKDNWPHNALELAEVMFKTFSDVAKSNYGQGNATPAQFAMQVCKLSIPCCAPDKDSRTEQEDSLAAAMTRIAELVTSLREISSLDSQYACKLSLRAYQKENTKTIAFRLLDRVLVPELIPATVEKYVKPYAAKHSLIADELLLAYVDDLIERQPRISSSIWHSKLIAITECIKNKELKCTATMRIMSVATSPWSSDVQKLVNAMIESHPNNEELKHKYRFAELKTTMMKYGIRNYGAAGAVKGEDTIRYIFKCDIESALEDAIQVANTYIIDHKTVYFHRIEYWIMKDKIEESCNLLRSLDVKTSVAVASSIISWTIITLEDAPLDDEDKISYNRRVRAAVEIGRTVSSLDSCFKRDKQELIQTLHNILALQLSYGIYISLEDYNDQEQKDGIWKDFVSETAKENEKSKLVTNETKDISIRSANAARLADLLGFDDVARQKQEIAVYLSKGNTKEALKILRNARNGIPSKKQLSLFRETLLYLLSERWNSDEKEHLRQWLCYVGDAHRLAAFATSACPEDELRDFLEITQQFRLALSVSEQCESADYRHDAFRQTDIFSKWTITERYEDDGMVLYSQEIIPLLRKYHKLCFQDIDQNAKYETNCVSGSFTVGEVLKDLAGSSNSIVKVLRENNHQTLALQYILKALGICLQSVNCCDVGFPIPEEIEPQIASSKKMFSSMLPFANQSIHEIINGLFTKVLTHRHIDHDLGLGYLCSLPSKNGIETMTALKGKFGSKYRRMEAGALIGVDYAGLRSDTELLKACQQLQDCAYWGKKFVSLKIPLKDVYGMFHLSVEEKEALVQRLASNPNVNVTVLIKFCRTFRYDVDEALYTYIRTLLLPASGSKGDPAYREKVYEAFQHVESTENLYKALQSSLNLINPYDYERLFVVIEKMEDIKPGSVNVLKKLFDLLNSYERCSPPAEFELSLSSHSEDEQLLHGSGSRLPEAAKVRLPFHPLMGDSPWKLLSPELKSESVVRKIESIVRCMQLDTNVLYTNAIHNIVSNSFQGEGKESTFPKDEQKEFKFDSVKGLLASVSDTKMAIAAAKWVAKLLPTGDEKVKALKACVDLCKELEQSCDESELQTVKDWTRKFGSLCKRTEVAALLSKHGILDEAYRNLTLQPAALICKLYEDFGCKAEIVNGRVTGIPDIHQIAQEIATINNTNLHKVKMYLLENWLPSSAKQSNQDGDTTIIDTTVASEELDADNLKRVIYILNNNSQADNAGLLLLFAFDEKSSSTLTYTCKIRTLQALFSLVSVESIEGSSGQGLNVEQIRKHLTSIVYAAELEALHLPQDLNAFSRCNKEGLVKGLWRNHSHEPRGLRLIRNLCLDYKIYDVQLWNILLPQFLAFGMVSRSSRFILKIRTIDELQIDYLRHTLVVLCGIPELREYLPMSPFISLPPALIAKATHDLRHDNRLSSLCIVVSTPLSDEEEAGCLESANLIQRCPVILDLNMQDIAMRYQKIEMHPHALACLTLIPEAAVKDHSIDVCIAV